MEDQQASLLLKIISLSTEGVSQNGLSQITGFPVEKVGDSLLTMQQKGLIVYRSYKRRYAVTDAGATYALSTKAWKQCNNTIVNVIQCIESNKILDGCAALLEFINTLMNSFLLNGAISLYRLLISILKIYDLEKNKKDRSSFLRISLDVCDISMYLSKFHNDALAIARKSIAHAEKQDTQITNILYLLELSLENMAAECDEERMDFMHKKCEYILHEMKKNKLQGTAEYFLGMFQFWHGQFNELLETVERAKQTVPLWNCRFQTEMFPLYTSSSAVYIGNIHMAVGILESARREASLNQNVFKTLWWEAQLAMVLLYVNHDEEALELIDHVLSVVNYATETKIALWGMRGLSYYLFKNDNIKSSYIQMKRIVDTGKTYGVRRLIYSYPWLLEVLLRYREEGFPSIEGLELETELSRSLRSYNSHLKASGLRIKAIMAYRDLEEVESVKATLQASLDLFSEVGNPHEVACTRFCIDQLEKGVPLTSKILSDFRGKTQFAPREKNPPALLSACLPLPEKDKDIKNYLEKVLAITSNILGAERGAFLRLLENGKFNITAKYNISELEISIGEVTAHILRYRSAQDESPLILDIEKHVNVTIPVRTDHGRWVLWLESRYAVDALLSLSQKQLVIISDVIKRCLIQSESIRVQSYEHQVTTGASVSFDLVGSDSDTMLYSSPEMNRLVSYCSQVGKSDASILILGETGVGKDLLARFIHESSGRTGKFVVVHPASIPETLFESEFFGYERGAFTGAIKRKIGLVEHAHQGTLFIDEAGDIPEAHQVRLLRVLQDHSFIRVGGDNVLHSNFRLVCATNKDLWHEVQKGRFREDLYYRISVVPVTIPPLRERREDIEQLIPFFIEEYARRYNKEIPQLSAMNMRRLREYSWPGNIRELKSVIERAVITCMNGELTFQLNENSSVACEPAPARIPSEGLDTGRMFGALPSLQELQRNYIEYVLKKTNWRITGEMGALKILQVKRSTLYHWLKKYQISRHWE